MNYQGTWTNDTVDIALRICQIYRENDESLVCRYVLFNKKTNDVYEIKKGKIDKRMFEWNYKV